MRSAASDAMATMHLLCVLCFGLSLASASTASLMYTLSTKYLPAAPDSVARCTVTDNPVRSSCESLWSYHPIPGGPNGPIAMLDNSSIYIITQPNAFSNNSFGAINTSNPQDVTVLQQPVLQYAVSLLAWRAGGALLIADGAYDGYQYYGPGQLIQWDPSNPSLVTTVLRFRNLLKNYSNCSLAQAVVFEESDLWVAQFWCGSSRVIVELNLRTGASKMFPLEPGSPHFAGGTWAAVAVGTTSTMTEYVLNTRSRWSDPPHWDVIALEVSQLANTTAEPLALVENLEVLCGFQFYLEYPSAGRIEKLFFDSRWDVLYLSLFWNNQRTSPFDDGHILYALSNATSLLRGMNSSHTCRSVTSFTGPYDMVGPMRVAFPP